MSQQRPGPPPMMMQPPVVGSSSTTTRPTVTRSNADEIIARRRAQLRMLQQRTTGSTSSKPTTNIAPATAPPPSSAGARLTTTTNNNNKAAAPPPPIIMGKSHTTESISNGGVTNGRTTTIPIDARKRSQSAPKQRSPLPPPPSSSSSATAYPPAPPIIPGLAGRTAAATTTQQQQRAPPKDRHMNTRPEPIRITPAFPIKKKTHSTGSTYTGGVAFDNASPLSKTTTKTTTTPPTGSGLLSTPPLGQHQEVQQQQQPKRMPQQKTPFTKISTKSDMLTPSPAEGNRQNNNEVEEKKTMPTKGTPFPRGNIGTTVSSSSPYDEDTMTPDLKNEEDDVTKEPKTLQLSQSTEEETDTMSSPPIQTPRRDLLNNLRQYAPTPPSQSTPTDTTTTATAGASTTSSTTDNGLKHQATSTELRLVRDFREAVSAKTDALSRVAKLEGELKQLQEERKKTALSSVLGGGDKGGAAAASSATLRSIIQMAESNGSEAAIQFTKKQLQQAKINDVDEGFSLSLSNGSFTPPRSKLKSPLHVSKASEKEKPQPTSRIATPKPKRRTGTSDGNDNNNTLLSSEEEREYLIAASKVVPSDYTSDLATYIVRRPYTSTVDDDSNDIDEETMQLWNIAGTVSNDMYQQIANVNTSSTVEIIARINADGSLLALSDISNARHCKHPNLHDSRDNEWKVYDNVDNMDKPLGCIMYIDSDACEQEYWLDTIYEEAIVTRDAYCACLISTATGLQKAKQQQPQFNPPPQQQQQQQPPPYSENGVGLPPPGMMMPPSEQQQQQPQLMAAPSVDTVDACVGTDPINPKDMLPPDTSDNSKRQQQQQPQQDQGGERKRQAPPPPQEMDDDGSSSDVLSMMIVSFFAFIFSTIWSIFVKIPLKAMSLSIQLAIAICILSILWLYIADDHGAYDMGIHHNYDPPRIF